MNSEGATSKQGGSKKKGQKSSKVWGAFALGLVLLCVAALVIIGLSQLFKSNETVTSSGPQTISSNAMVCEAAAPKDPFFTVEGATDVEHQIKVIYKNGVADKISYEYDAEMGTPEAAIEAEARTHADYNNFMGKRASDFSASFMPMDDEYKITITANMDDLGSSTARIFFISKEDFEGLKDFQIENLRKIMQTAGFHCEMDED